MGVETGPEQRERNPRGQRCRRPEGPGPRVDVTWTTPSLLGRDREKNMAANSLGFSFFSLCPVLVSNVDFAPYLFHKTAEQQNGCKHCPGDPSGPGTDPNPSASQGPQACLQRSCCKIMTQISGTSLFQLCPEGTWAGLNLQLHSKKDGRRFEGTAA